MEKFKKIGEIFAESENEGKKALEYIEKQGFSVLIDNGYSEGTRYIVLEKLP